MPDGAPFAEYVDQRRQRMVRQLAMDVERRSPLSDAWRRAFLRAPRHLFVERIHSNGSVYRRTDRYWRHWLDLIYDERQVTLLASMLGELDVGDEHRVLLVGAGTGYACAVLCERLTGARVTMVDPDPHLVARARRNLAEAGHTPAGAVRAYSGGHPPNAPYDRILIDRPLPELEVPHTLVEQLGPGGVMVGMLSDGAVFLVARNEPGQAEGGFRWYAWATSDFMPTKRTLRGQAPRAGAPVYPERTTDLSPDSCTLGGALKLHQRLTVGEISSDTFGFSGGISSPPSGTATDRGPRSGRMAGSTSDVIACCRGRSRRVGRDRSGLGSRPRSASTETWARPTSRSTGSPSRLTRPWSGSPAGTGASHGPIVRSASAARSALPGCGRPELTPLRCLAAIRCWDQRALAEAAGVSQATVSRARAGRAVSL